MTTFSGRVSVAMAVCNGEKFLDQQLDSLLRQTRAPDEIIISDDASDDGTAGIVAGWQRRKPELIRVLTHPERLGSSRNFELAIAAATGDFIFPADQDDVWHPDKIARMTAAAEPDRPCGVFSDSAVTAADLTPTGVTHWECRGFSSARLAAGFAAGPAERLGFFLRRVPAAGHDMAFSAALRPLLLPFPALPDCYDSWIGLVLAALDLWKIIPEPLVDFRQHTANASGSGRISGWSDQLRTAIRSAAGDSAVWHVRLYDELIRRLDRRLGPEVRFRLADRRDHSAARAAMNVPLGRRWPLIAGEIRNRRYFHYGRGWKSVVQDLLLRRATATGPGTESPET